VADAGPDVEKDVIELGSQFLDDIVQPLGRGFGVLVGLVPLGTATMLSASR